MRVLVTGGCGFIGSHFVKRLVAGGYEVVVLDKLTYSGNLANLEGVDHTFVHGDIADPVAVAGAGEGCHAVVNFAAETHVDRSILAAGDFVRTDVVGTHVLLEWARDSGVRLVQVSTDEVYGDGRQQRAWVHVEDKCAAIDLVLRKGEPGGVYNIGGEERDNLEVTKLILELSGADPGLVRHVADRPGHDRRYGLDSARIHALGWKPRRAFEQGLAETVAWYRERRDWWEPIKSGEYRRYYDQQYAARLRE